MFDFLRWWPGKRLLLTFELHPFRIQPVWLIQIDYFDPLSLVIWLHSLKPGLSMFDSDVLDITTAWCDGILQVVVKIRCCLSKCEELSISNVRCLNLLVCLLDLTKITWPKISYHFVVSWLNSRWFSETPYVLRVEAFSCFTKKNSNAIEFYWQFKCGILQGNIQRWNSISLVGH